MTFSLPLEKRHHLRVVSVVSVVSQHFAVFRAFGPAAVPFPYPWRRDTTYVWCLFSRGKEK